MFVCVARVTLDIPAAASLKGKRQVLRRVTDRVKAKFNVAVAEVEDNEIWNRAVVGLSVVANEGKFAQEQMDKILHFIEELYVAPVAHRETEVISFNDFFGPGDGHDLTIPTGERSLAEAEGMGAWEDRHEVPVPTGRAKKALTLDQRRAAARALRKPREWEKP